MFPLTAKILIVDDFSTMRKIIKKNLTEIGFTNMEEADDGATAWPLIEAAKAKGTPYDLIISDWNMPKMQGIDLLKTCRANPLFKGVPFMLVTAESEQTQILEAVKAGVSDYVVKPFNSNTLKAKLENVWLKFNKTAKAA